MEKQCKKLNITCDSRLLANPLRFGANAQPYYVALNSDGKPIAPSYAFDENVDKYIEFLQTGLKNFKK